MKINNIISFLILLTLVNANTYKVILEYDEFLGDAEGVIQYYEADQVQIIRGNSNRGSADGNIGTVRTMSGDSQEFIIKNATGKVINIWLLNSLIDEDLAEEEDYFLLAKSRASIEIFDMTTGKDYQIAVPWSVKGLAFHAASIIDNEVNEIGKMFSDMRTYSVTVVDAIEAQTLSDVAISVIKESTGEVISRGRTDSEGRYSGKFNYGIHIVQFSKDGYITGKHKFNIDITDLPVAMHFAMTPAIEKFRIVLTWGTIPYDLDAHLTGPKPEGGTFHIWYGNKTLIGGKNFLDRDDMKSFGPETITIYKPAKGEYRYAVHNYSNRSESMSRKLSFSNARVDVYSQNKLQASFQVPRDITGNVWEVFKIDKNQQIIPIGQIKGRTSSKLVFD